MMNKMKKRISGNFFGKFRQQKPVVEKPVHFVYPYYKLYRKP